MEQLFSIGETAAINQVSLKSLRYYDKIGLLKSAYIDKETKYRYYTYSQFAYIDKIKRYKSLGMPLKDIKDFFDSQNLDKIEEFLNQQKTMIEEESHRLEQLKYDIDYLTEFFQYSKQMRIDNEITKRYILKRHIIASKCEKDDDIFQMDMDLRQMISNDKLDKLPQLNPYGYILDYQNILNHRIGFLYSFVTTSPVTTAPSETILELPEGEYVCFKAAIFSEDVDIKNLVTFLQEEKRQPKIIVACEYLKSFYDPLSSPYEIQVLF